MQKKTYYAFWWLNATLDLPNTNHKTPQFYGLKSLIQLPFKTSGVPSSRGHKAPSRVLKSRRQELRAFSTLDPGPASHRCACPSEDVEPCPLQAPSNYPPEKALAGVADLVRFLLRGLLRLLILVIIIMASRSRMSWAGMQLLVPGALTGVPVLKLHRATLA